MRKQHLLCFGFGFSAQALARHMNHDEWQITGTSRSVEGAAAITSQGYEGVRFNDLYAIPATVTHIVSSVPPDADGDPVARRFSKDLERPFEWISYLSTTGVYGNHHGGWVDEDTPLTPNTERGARRVAAEQAWSQYSAHIFRLAGIYGPGRNVILNLRDGTAKRVIKPGQIFSRIHVEDIAGLLLASMAKPNPGRAYNVADDEPCPPQDVVEYAAKLLGLPVPHDVPFEQAQLSAMARSFYEDSKRVSNARVKQELGYQFKYPSFRDGLKGLV
jgi:nucleoside-diphosphate-sugar epimerase